MSKLGNFTDKDINPSIAKVFTDIGRRFVDGTLSSQRVMRHLIANVADSSAISNTVDLTNFSTNYTISNPLFQVGRLLIVTANGVYSTTGTPTLLLRVRFGTTNLISFAAKTGINNASNQAWGIKSYIVTRTLGSSGTVMASGTLFFQDAANRDTIETVVNNSATTIDTTVSQTLQISATWSAASVSNTATLKNFIVELSDYDS